MAIETLDDIAEQVADWCRVYGACDGTCHNERCCRVGFVPALIERMRRAAMIEWKLEQPFNPSEVRDADGK